jgi:predicted DNA-binding protein (MmcQ/YjbR family)
MKALIKLFAVSAIITITSCSNERKRGALIYDSNNENGLWRTTGAVIKSDKAHTGSYLNKINKDNPYSNTFEIQVKDISSKPLTKVYLSAYMMLTEYNTEQNLVLEIRDSTGQNLTEWLSINAADYIDKPNEWVKIENVLDLTINNRNNLDYFYRVYATNGKEGAVYVDDFEIEFE